MEVSSLHGIYVPTITPLTSDERVDEPSLRRLVDFLVDHGVHGIWSMGTTGEFPCLPEDERARGVRTTVEQVAGRVPVIASVGDSSTGLAIRHAKRAAEAGADVIAATPPHYYPIAMDEAIDHFRALKQAVPDLPLMIYNIPQTVKVKMTVEAALTLAKDGTCAGIKDSQNDLQWFRSLVEEVRDAGLEDRFRCFLGTRQLIDAGVAIGAVGAIPANSNVAPSFCVQAYDAAIRGDRVAATEAQKVAIAYEALDRVAKGGSPNSATISSMKHVLKLWGVIDSTTITRPMRGLKEDEIQELQRRLEALPKAKVTAA